MDARRTLFRPGENCTTVAHAGRASLLVDAQAYYEAFVLACERAERSILIVGWDFDSRMVLRYAAEGKPEVLLGDFLNGLAQRNRRLRIHILDWDYPMIFGRDREFPPIYGLTWRPHRHIDFRYDDTHPLAGSHHQKLVIVDDRLAFVGGIDLSSKRWDSTGHTPGDVRRTFRGEPYPPMHDVMAAVDGEAARALSDIAHSRWKGATGETLGRPEVPGDGWPEGLPVQIEDVGAATSCTSPPCGSGEPVRQIERLYLDMIGAARDYIYIENQYFTSQAISDALKARLGEPQGPEIVIVTRLLSHGWLEAVTMHVLRARLVRELRAADVHKRLRVYYPHVEGLAENTCIDLHSKVMVVDDEWLRAGSSNLSNRSMGMDSECDITFEARGEAGVREAIRRFRDTLLAEHSGAALEAFEAESARHEGRMIATIEALPRPARRLEPLEAPELSESQIALAAVADLEKPLPLEGMVREFSPDTSSVVMLPGRRVLVLLCLGAAALALLWAYSPLSNLVTRQHILEWGGAISRFAWAPLLIVLAYTPAAYTMFPRWLITMVAVIAFGPWRGFIYGLCGMLLAALISYLPGRLVRRDTVRRLAGPRVNRMSAVLHQRGALAVAIVRLLPVAPYVVVNLVMGAMRIRLRDFLVGSAIGLTPGMLASTVLGEQVSRALADPARVNGWLIALAAVILMGLVYFGQRWLRRLERRPAAAR